MGIDFSHCDAHWAYPEFMQFRSRLAKEIGVEIMEMEGFIENGRRWRSLPPDPIIGLLFHSDCDGELSPEECERIAPRLRELVSKWPDDDYDKMNALDLAIGMETAACAFEPLRFT